MGGSLRRKIAEYQGGIPKVWISQSEIVYVYRHTNGFQYVVLFDRSNILHVCGKKVFERDGEWEGMAITEVGVTTVLDSEKSRLEEILRTAKWDPRPKRSERQAYYRIGGRKVSSRY